MKTEIQIGKLKLNNNVFLAPMAGITDMPFRLICKEMGAGLTYTEMVSSMGIHYNSEKTEELSKLNPKEKPAAIQIFGRDPEIMANTASHFCDEGADLIDINMGCPAPKIVKSGHGSALMLEPKLASKIITEVVKACSKTNTPVTVKFRKSFDHIGTGANAVEFAHIAEECGASAVTVHGRTRSDFYSGTADWEIIKKVKEAVKSIPVIGNGDITSPEKAKQILNETNCDAIMIGRAAEGNPWIFKRTITYLKTGILLPEPTNEEKINMALRHFNDMIAYKGEYIGIREMRKHLSWYLKGFPNSSKIKDKINKSEIIKEIIDIISNLNI